MGIKDKLSGNSFRDGLSVYNPASQYYNPKYDDDVQSKVSKSNADISGNVRIGVIDNDRGRW